MQVLDARLKALPDAVRVHAALGRHLLTDGYDLVLDMDASQGIHLRDAVTGRDYLDLFTFYASNPLGMNHPKLAGPGEAAEAFRARLMDAALNKVANSDVYTPHMARFVETFSRVGIPPELPHAFFVDGGALAIENALKVAFDWKVRKNWQRGYTGERGQQVLHFEQAFHGRSGYTMSLTNTDPNKTALFPKFDWPRIPNPKMNGPADAADVEAREARALDLAKAAFHDRKDDIAAIILEPIQAEGGDNHFRPEFLRALRQLADENEALLIFDEVQTGVGMTGTFWAFQGLGVVPDVLAFGKKTQVCGILAGRRVDEVEDNVFVKSSRINSTWGGNLVDMVRFDRILEVIEEDGLLANAQRTGAHLLARLGELAGRQEAVTNPRGRGLMCAFDLPDTATRNAVVEKVYDLGAVVLGCGPRAVRFRPALCVTEADLDRGLDVVERAITSVLEG
jgi:L-lysine 6-transaminase